MRRILWTALAGLTMAAVTTPAQAMAARFTCTGYSVIYDDGTQRCTLRCTICRGYDANGELIYEGEPYCNDHGCIQVT